MSALRKIGNWSFALALTGGLCGAATQWILFEPGNFSEAEGAIFIPLLGEHGIYTSKIIGIAWYGCSASFIIGSIGVAVAWLLMKRAG